MLIKESAYNAWKDSLERLGRCLSLGSTSVHAVLKLEQGLPDWIGVTHRTVIN